MGQLKPVTRALLAMLLGLWVLSQLVPQVAAGKLLLFIPFMSKSMKITFMPLVEQLAQRGHQITLVYPFKSQEKLHQNIIEIIPDNSVEAMLDDMSRRNLEAESNPIVMMMSLFQAIDQNIDKVLSDVEVRKLLANPEGKFDAVMCMPFFGNEAGYFLAKHFKAEIILYFTGQSSFPWLNWAMGQPHHPAFMPLILFPFDSNMNLVQRCVNVLGTFFFHFVVRNGLVLSRVEQVLARHFPDSDVPSLSELEKNASLAISFGHPMLMDGWRPTSHNFVSVGMMNCRPPTPFRPEDKALERFLGDSNNNQAVVFVSFGSVIKGSGIPDDRRQAFVKVFRKFPKVKFIWKWETGVMEDKPDNVMLVKWAPQQNVLAHPNVKLFISHGGQSSFQESICHKKPLLVISVTGDQISNGREAERLQIGRTLRYYEVKEDNLAEAINSLLNDTSYLSRVSDLSDLMMDQMNQPLDRAVWWIEHIFRHPGTYVSRSPVHQLYWFQYFLLDVLLVYSLIAMAFGFLMLKCLRCLCCRRRSHDDTIFKIKRH